MTINMLIFIFLAIVAIAAAAGLILSRNPVYSALFLILNFLAVACLLPHPGSSIHCPGADHGLRRCHHGALPVRHHAAWSCQT